MQDHFKDRAEIWNSGNTRVKGALTIADAIKGEIQLTHDMEILDFGIFLLTARK